MIKATRAISETIGLEKAVQAAHEMLGDDETLFIVTADHAHTMTIGGIYRYFIILKVVSVVNLVSGSCYN